MRPTSLQDPKEGLVNRSALNGVRQWLRDWRESLGSRCYSQEGEDLILARYFHDQREGFFVDVGAHHPHRFSNTYLLYRRGWRGVNIDAMPGSMRNFRRSRPRDINIEAAIGSTRGSSTYFVFNEPALNTFDPELAAERNAPPWKIVSTISLPIRPLADVLDEVVPRGQTIDLLTIDAEGRDLDVLQSNDWSRYRARMVLAETRGRDLSEVRGDPVTSFLEQQGYAVTAKTFNTTFMLDARAR